ncbi:MAG: hypothetical protein VB064_08275 [Oscillospiraceae bacterium]|nr:hypothetical protein [Oscillospiraceae bacterium]
MDKQEFDYYADDLEQLKTSLRMEIANRLTDERKRRFKNQSDAVAEIDYRIISDNSAWCRYENGKRGIPTELLYYLHVYWNIDLNYLLTGDETTLKVKKIPAEIQGHILALANYFDNCQIGN